MVVDDDVDTRDAVREQLEDAGYAALTARSGREAFTLLLGGARPRAMVVDLEMADGDGLMLCESCDSIGELAQIPRLICSGSREAPRTAGRCRARALIGKPVLGLQLLEAVRGLIGAPHHGGSLRSSSSTGEKKLHPRAATVR